MDRGNPNWIQKNGLIDSKVTSIYINSLYFAIVTIITIGYGDVTAQSDIEKLFVILMAFLSCNNFAYSINQIGNILNEYNIKKQNFRKNISEINKFMREREVPKDLQGKARKYLEYVYSESESINK